MIWRIVALVAVGRSCSRTSRSIEVRLANASAQPRLAAGAARALGLDDHVAHFAGHTARASMCSLTVDNEAAADARADEGIPTMVWVLRPPP